MSAYGVFAQDTGFTAPIPGVFKPRGAAPSSHNRHVLQPIDGVGDRRRHHAGTYHTVRGTVTRSLRSDDEDGGEFLGNEMQRKADPREHRTTRTISKLVSRRQWFRATTTFQASTDGAEQLSPNGRQQIDNAVAPMVQAFPSQPIIVEGYSVQGSRSQQFVTSRKRAEIVRRYLETHYHLNHQNLGIVALCNRPPDGAGVGDWDGAAIVLVNAGEATQ